MRNRRGGGKGFQGRRKRPDRARGVAPAPVPQGSAESPWPEEDGSHISAETRQKPSAPRPPGSATWARSQGKWNRLGGSGVQCVELKSTMCFLAWRNARGDTAFGQGTPDAIRGAGTVPETGLDCCVYRIPKSGASISNRRRRRSVASSPAASPVASERQQ